MQNVGQIISSHNRKILNGNKSQPDNRTCNCLIKSNCPLDGECQQKNVIYKAAVESGNTVKCYIGLCEGDFKLRFNNHKKSITHSRYRNDTELSKYIWSLKDSGRDYNLSWTIMAKCYTNAGSDICNLCLTEKLFILEADKASLLNRRDELISKCRHQNKYSLKHVIGRRNFVPVNLTYDFSN